MTKPKPKPKMGFFQVFALFSFVVLGTATAQNGVRLAGILDTTSFEWAPTIFDVTVELLNDANNGFFDYLRDQGTLRDNYVHYDLGPISFQLVNSECDEFEALSAYFELAQPVHGVIGARCSGASKQLAWMGAIDNVPQISMSSTSAKLSDKSEFPYFSRVVAPDDERGQVGAMIALLNLLGWDRISVINTDTAYAKDLATSLLNTWEGEVSYLATVKVSNNGVDEDSLRKVLQEAPLKDPANNSKVVVLLAHSEHAFPILDVAQNYFPEETFWVGPEAWAGREPPSDWKPNSIYPGYLGVVPYRDPENVMYQRFLNLAGDSLKPYLNDEGLLPDYGAEYTIDAIIAMVHALAYTPPDSRSDGKFVSEMLRKIWFEGVTGQVWFHEQGDRFNPQFSIVNYRKVGGKYKWRTIGTAGLDDAKFDRVACFGGVGCSSSSFPDHLPPVPPDATKVWAPIVIAVLCLIFLFVFCNYRHTKITASRKQKEILMAKEAELNDFRNSVVDMCTAEQQYVPKIPDNSNGITQPSTRIQWCWKETEGYAKNWGGEMIEGDPNDCWIKYDQSANAILESAYTEQNSAGHCMPVTGYTVDFSLMIQTKDKTGFERVIKRVVDGTSQQAMDLSTVQVASNLPDDIRFKEPQMILVPGDIVQISKKRNDNWAYGSKLHLENEPLGRRLVQISMGNQDHGGNANDDDDEDKMIITDNHGWFPMDMTRKPDTNDLAILRKTLGEADDLGAPPNWDPIADPSVVQKSKPLRRENSEYKKLADSFLSTLSSKHRIVSIERIQNIAMWQSYLVKRKTVIDRDKSLGRRSSFIQQHGQTRFERRWLWHGTNVS